MRDVIYTNRFTFAQSVILENRSSRILKSRNFDYESYIYIICLWYGEPNKLVAQARANVTELDRGRGGELN